MSDPVDLPVRYQLDVPTVPVPRLAVRALNGDVNYFDVSLRNISGGNPDMYVVESMVESVLGVSGAKGDTGDVGARGPSGATGAAGAPGVAGTNGTNGAPGVAGANGTNGVDGAPGPAGTNGTNGVDGKTLLSGAVDPAGGGSIGDFYLNTSTHMLFGPKGAGGWPLPGTSLVGPAGAAGVAGTNGTNGVDGAPGVAGTNGTNGVDGAPGLAGTPGVQGIQGIQGLQGLQGIPGPAGGGMMTGSSSGTVVLTSVLGGLASTQSVLPLYGYVDVAPTVVNVLGGSIALSVGTYAMAQPFPVNTTLTRIQAMVGVSVAVVNAGFTKVSATLYRLPAAGGPAVPAGLACDLAPSFPLIVVLNAEAKCSGTGSAVMNAGDRGFIVFSVDGLGLATALTLSVAASVAP